jgi:hypothetical protein
MYGNCKFCELAPFGNHCVDCKHYFTIIEKQNKLLKKTVVALSKINLAYRVGKAYLPDSVFKTIEQAHNIFGNDLTKLK